MKKTLLFLVLMVVLLLLLNGCKDKHNPDPKPIPLADLQNVVFSDPHHHYPFFGISSSAFEVYPYKSGGWFHIFEQ